MSLRSKLASYELIARSGSSDREVFDQIFIEQEYNFIPPLNPNCIIVDAGANVGYSSAYFLSRYPNCKVIAVEPDPGNFEILKRNLRPFGRRVELLNKALWNENTFLSFTNLPYRDGKEWARQVTSNHDGQSHRRIAALSMESLIEQYSLKSIDLLKIDIEGAEAVVFGSGNIKWLTKVEKIVVELHEDTFYGPCKEIFHSTVKNEEFDKTEHGELLLCLRKMLGRVVDKGEHKCM